MNLPLDPNAAEISPTQVREGLLFVDAQTQQVVDLNSAFEELSEHTRESLIGKTLAQVFERGDFFNPLSPQQEHQTFIVGPNGKRIEVTVQIHQLAVNENLLLFVREVKQAKPEYQQLDGFSRQLIANIQEGIIYYDHELRYRFWNRFMEELSGYSETEVLGQQPWILFPFLQKQGLKENLTRALNGERVAIADVWVDYPRTGIKGWVSANYSPVYGPDQSIVGVFTTLRDHTDQLLSAEAVRKNEERYRALVENASEGTNILSLDGAVLYESPVSPRLLGYTSEELVGRNALSHVHPDDLANIQNKLKEVVENPETIFDVSARLLKKDGSLVWMEGKAYNLVENPSVNGIVLNWRDVTRRRKAEDQVQKDRQFLTSIIQTAAEGICVCAGRSEHPYIRFQIWNAQMEKITGYTLDEINHLGWYQSMYPDPEHQALAIARMERMHKGEDLHGEIWPITRKDGETRILMISTSGVEVENGEVVTVALMQDITEQNQAQRALRESQHMLRLVLDNIPQGVFWKDRSSKYLGCNRVVANAFGLPSDEAIIGKDDYSLNGLSQTQADFFIQKDREVIEKNQPELGILEEATLADDRTIWMETNKVPIRDENNEIVGVLGTWQDVTERQKIAEALQASEERYRAFVSQSTEGIWRFQFEPPIPTSLPVLEQVEQIFQNGYLAESNDAFARMYDFEESSKIIGVRLSELLPRDDPKNIAHLREFVESGYLISDAESYEVDRHGNPRIFLNSIIGTISDGVLLYAWGTQRDITERKKAAEALRTNEERYRAFVSQSTEGIWRCQIISPIPTELPIAKQIESMFDQGYLAECNDAFAKMYGYSQASEIIGTRIDQLLIRDDPKNIAYLTAFIESGYQLSDVESSEVDRFGNPRVFVNSLVGTVAEGGLLYAWGMQRDVTERNKAEEQLRASEKKLSAIAATMPQGLYVYDLTTNQTIYSNRELWRDLGYSPDESNQFGESFRKARLHPDDLARIPVNLKRWEAAQDHQIFETEYRVLNSKNEWRWYQARDAVYQRDSSGKVTQVIGTAQDITERKIAEDRLRRSESNLAEAQKLGLIGSWDLDLITKEVYWSEQQYLQMGREPNTPIPTLEEFISFIHPDDRERIQGDIQHCFVTGVPVDHEFRLCLPNGQIRWIHGRGTVQFNDNGQPIKFFGLSQDVTEYKRAEAEKRKLELQLQQTQKLESLGVLAGGIAHDFNNLLTSILGYADLALDELPEGVSTRDLIEEMINGAHQAADLTRQMLAYSGKGRFKVEALNLTTLVESLSRLLQISISKKCSIRSQLDPNLPAIEGDAPQVRQVIMNLVINASEAIGDNTGLIGVLTGVQHHSQNDLAEYPLNDHLIEGDYVFLEVADTGSGMSQETLSKIFDPFFTTKFTGRGLGLSAVLGIVRGHKGAIKCTSELGKGTTFKVIFPVSPLEYAQSGKSNTNSNPWRGSGVVLVVDDEASVRNLTKTMLEKMGFQVRLANDGYEGVKIYRESFADTRLILLDLTMPKLDGEQTFREIQSISPNTPVILSSGYSEAVNQERYAHLGFAGFIQKPYRYEELRDVVQKALSQK